jgi:hypothetical protein
MVEVVLCLGILSVALVPIVGLFSSSHRIGHSAQRLVDVTLHAQMLLEALAELDAEEIPSIPAGSEQTLMADGGPSPRRAGARFNELVQFFAKKPPVEMTRTIVARRLASGELLLRVDVEWLAVARDPATRQAVSLRMLSIPRSWR